MTSFLRQYKIHIMCFILGGFLIAIALNFGGSFMTHNTLTTDPIVEVNGDKIPLRLFESHYQRATAQLKAPPDKAAEAQLRQETVRDLVQSVVFSNEARNYGIAVPDGQVATSIGNVPAFQTKGAFDPQLYGQILSTQLRSTPQDFEEEQRASIAFFKLRWLFQSVMKVTDKELDMAYALRLKDPAYKGQPRTDKKASFKPGTAEDRQAFQDQWSQQKMIWTFNQWYSQIGQKLNVKTHFELLDGNR